MLDIDFWLRLRLTARRLRALEAHLLSLRCWYGSSRLLGCGDTLFLDGHSLGFHVIFKNFAFSWIAWTVDSETDRAIPLAFLPSKNTFKDDSSRVLLQFSNGLCQARYVQELTRKPASFEAKSLGR